MQRSVLILLSAVLVFSACKKDAIQPTNAESTGLVLYGGDPAAAAPASAKGADSCPSSVLAGCRIGRGD